MGLWFFPYNNFDGICLQFFSVASLSEISFPVLKGRWAGVLRVIALQLPFPFFCEALRTICPHTSYDPLTLLPFPNVFPFFAPLVPNVTNLDSTHRSLCFLGESSCKEDLDNSYQKFIG